MDSQISNLENTCEIQDEVSMCQSKRRTVMQLIDFIDDKLVEKLLVKSIIHSKDTSEDYETECYEKILKLLKDITKVKFCKELIEVVTQCEKLKIIFDFESDLVDNAALHDSQFHESPVTGKTISIGAKLSSTRTEQDIKGALAREFCLLALSLTYETTSHPYNKHDVTAALNINQIIQKISNWTSEGTDKSSGIISPVIKSATPDNIQMELLATFVQILVQFDDDEEVLTRFEVKFKELFDYFEIFVLSEMKNLNLKLRENVRKFIRIAGGNLPCLGLELSELKDVKSLTENNLSIIQTNLPKLLLINIQKSSYKNIFVSTEKLQSCQELLHNLLAQDSTLNVFVTFSGAGKIDENFTKIFNSTKFIFIVSDDVQCQELAEELTELGLNPTKVEVNYSWNDLTVDSQKLLLKIKINFQNNLEFSFLDILKDEFNPEDEEVARNFNDVVDDQLLGMMIEGLKIEVNSGKEYEEIDGKAFQERNFIRKNIRILNQDICLSQHEVLSDVHRKKIILISAKPGSGKTWSMKYFAKILHKANPTSWVTYVDLKQFSVMLKHQMAKGGEIDFPIFFAETILNLKTKFEARIFIKMYELGNVFIFLDELDELSPSSAEFIARSAKSFESNEGSQFWIATCGHIEVDVKGILQLADHYELCELNEENCAKLIAASWVLNEVSDNRFDSYQKLAMDLLIKNEVLKFKSIGMPQWCKMIAEITKDDKICITELTELTIFREFTQMYKKVSNLQESGTDDSKLNFWTFHELIAVRTSFPNYSEFCDQGLKDLMTSTDQDNTSAGLVTKNGQNFSFQHESHRDYFMAEFILRTLKQKEVSNWFVQLLLKVLTTRRYQCIRMFLEQGIGDFSKLKLRNQIIKNVTNNIDEFTNISYVFMEGLENLQKLLVMFLNRRRYKVVKSIIESNFDTIFAAIKGSDVPINPQIFLAFTVNFLNTKCLQKFIKKKKLFYLIIESCKDIEHFEWLTNAVKNKLNSEFIVNNFKGSRRDDHANIFFAFCWSDNLDSQKAQMFLKILKGFFNVRGIMKLFKLTKDWNNYNIFTELIQLSDPDVLKILWTEIEKFYKSNESHRKFKELVMIFDDLYDVTDIKLQETFWTLWLKTFGTEELRKFFIENPSEIYYFLLGHLSVAENPQIIEFTFQQLQTCLTNEEIAKFTECKLNYGKNALFIALESAKNFEVFKFVWDLVRKFCKSNKHFLSLVSDVDNNGNCILAAALQRSDQETFDFIIQELKILATSDQIKSLLTSIDNGTRKIIHNIKNLKLFTAAWNLICYYLSASEILEIFQNCDSSGRNFILNIIYYFSYNDNDYRQQIWKSVKKFINEHEVISTEVNENIEKWEEFIEKIDEFKYKNHRFEELIKLKWLRTKSLRLLDCPETLKLQISQTELFSCAYDFYVLANCENFEIHEICWEFILKKYENREDLIKLMTQKSVHGSIFIHSLMSNKNIQIIKFILKIIQNNCNKSQIREILTVNQRNLLSIAIHDTKNVEIVEVLWTIHQNCYTSTELIDLINEINSNIMLNIAGISLEIFNFIWTEMEKLYKSRNEEDSQKLTELIMKRNSNRQTILHICVEQHNIELLQIVWNKVTKVFDGSLKSIIKLFELYENGYYDWYNDILKILELSIKSDNIEFHETLWGLLWETFKEQDELKSMILFEDVQIVPKYEYRRIYVADDSSCSESDEESNYSGDNGQYEQVQVSTEAREINNRNYICEFLCALLKSVSLDVIRLTMQNFDQILTKNEICKILASFHYYCFLDNQSNCIERHQMLWEIYRKYLTLADLGDFSGSFFNRVVCRSVTVSIEIFKFVWNRATKEAGIALISALENGSHIIVANINQKKDKEFLKVVWMEVKKFYEDQDLPESFKEFVVQQEYAKNIFIAANTVYDVEFHKTLWELLLSTFENREELKNALVRKIERRNPLIYSKASNLDSNVVEFIVKTLQTTFTVQQLQELLRTQPSLLSSFLCYNNSNFEIFKIWWEFIKIVFKTPKNLITYFEANNSFDEVFRHGCEQCLGLLFNDLNSLIPQEQIKKNLFKIDQRNILLIALHRGYNRENAYKLSWQFIHEHFEKQEIIDLIMKFDDNGFNFIFHVASGYPVNIFEIAWNEMKKVLSHKDQVRCLKEKNKKYGNLYKYASNYSRCKNFVVSRIEEIYREYKIRLN